jgi:serine phosphatase RsbU (regulator of sigma subunit)
MGPAIVSAEQVDYAAVFDALPTPYLLLRPDLVIAGANRAYLAATGRDETDLLGRHLFDAFPDDPDDPEARATHNLEQSLLRALRTGRPDTMPVQRYNIPVPGGFERRWWSPVNVPVLDPDGHVGLLVHRVEDVTAYVDRHVAPGGAAAPGDPLPVVDLYLRGHELRDALTEESVAALRLNGLVQVARGLGAAETLEELLEVVVGRGLQVLGAEGGLVAELDGDELVITATAAVDPEQRRKHDRAPLTGPLPSSVAAATRSPVLLPTREASLAWSPEMTEILAATGLVAWASLPLEVGPALLGSLTVGWRVEQEFSDRDVQLVGAFTDLLAQALQRVRRAERERERLARERAIMTELQLSLMSEPAQPEGLEVAVRYRPSSAQMRIGGDWFDAFTGTADRLDVVVGDVTGHDLQAATTMAELRNLLRAVDVTLGAPPAAVLLGLERAMARLGLDALATAVLAQVELHPAGDGTRLVRWSSAGHLPPVVLQPGGDAELVATAPEMLLGLLPSAPRSDHTLHLRPGAAFVLYTDGLVEDRSSTVPQGLERLVTTVRGAGGLSAEELCDRVLDGMDGGHDDDVALLVVRVPA